MDVIPARARARVCVFSLHVMPGAPTEARRGIGITDTCNVLPCVCWELTLGPLEELFRTLFLKPFVLIITFKKFETSPQALPYLLLF